MQEPSFGLNLVQLTVFINKIKAFGFFHKLNNQLTQLLFQTFRFYLHSVTTHTKSKECETV